MFSKKKESKNEEMFSVSNNVEDLFISNTNDDETDDSHLQNEDSKEETSSDVSKSEEVKGEEEKIDLSSLSRRDLKEYKRTGKIK